MHEFEIVCISEDSNHVITHVGLRNVGVFTVQSAVDDINNGKYGYYTFKAGQRAKVYTRQHSVTKRWFLTTNPDDTRENNLDFLPKCS